MPKHSDVDKDGLPVRHEDSTLRRRGSAISVAKSQLEWLWKSDQFNFLIDSVTFSEESRKSSRVQAHTNLASKALGLVYLSYIIYILVFTFTEQDPTITVTSSQYTDTHLLPKICFTDRTSTYTVQAHKLTFTNRDFGASVPPVELNLTSEYIVFEDSNCIEAGQSIQGTFADDLYEFVKLTFTPIQSNLTYAPGIDFWDTYYNVDLAASGADDPWEWSNKLYYSLMPSKSLHLEIFVDRFKSIKLNSLALQDGIDLGAHFSGESYVREEQYEESNPIFTVYFRSSKTEVVTTIMPYSIYDVLTDVGSVWTTLVFVVLFLLFWVDESPKAGETTKKLAGAAKKYLRSRKKSARGVSQAQPLDGPGEEHRAAAPDATVGDVEAGAQAPSSGDEGPPPQRWRTHTRALSSRTEAARPAAARGADPEAWRAALRRRALQERASSRGEEEKKFPGEEGEEESGAAAGTGAGGQGGPTGVEGLRESSKMSWPPELIDLFLESKLTEEEDLRAGLS